jgi:hypothetical protein
MWHQEILKVQGEHKEKLFALAESTRSLPGSNQDPLEIFLIEKKRLLNLKASQSVEARKKEESDLSSLAEE